MNGNSLGVALSSGGLAAAERSEGSPPGEPQRSGAAAKASADSGAASRPDPEVVAKAKRRTYTAEKDGRYSLITLTRCCRFAGSLLSAPVPAWFASHLCRLP